MMREMWCKVPHVCHHSYETGQLLLVCCTGHLGDALYLLQTRMHSLYAVFCPKERDSWLLKIQYFAVQNKAFYLGHIEEVDEVGIMVFLTGAIDHYVDLDADDSWAFLHNKVIFIWKTPCDILAPKGILLNLYLPLWVLITSNLLLSSVRCT